MNNEQTKSFARGAARVPGLSAIMCSHNGAALISEPLEALAAQRIPPHTGFEVILVDNRCADATVEIAETIFAGGSIPLKVAREPRPGLIHARRAGVRAAVYDILLFVDDDNILSPHWAERLREIYAGAPDVGGAGGRIAARFLPADRCGDYKPAWFDRFRGVYACTPEKEDAPEPVFRDTLYGAGLSLRAEAAAEVFDDASPFCLTGRTGNALLRGEDSEICLRARLAGWKLQWDPSLEMSHIIPPERACWDYVLRARRGGGAAELWLHMQRRLLEGLPPLEYEELRPFVAALWRDYRRRLARSGSPPRAREGCKLALKYAGLQGLSQACRTVDPDLYRQTRQALIARWTPRKPAPAGLPEQ